jgi:hypothetical protein
MKKGNGNELDTPFQNLDLIIRQAVQLVHQRVDLA